MPAFEVDRVQDQSCAMTTAIVTVSVGNRKSEFGSL